MQTLPIVEDFDVFEHGRLRLLAGSEADLVDVLGLERGEEALHGRVIEAVAAAAQRPRYPQNGARRAEPLDRPRLLSTENGQSRAENRPIWLGQQFSLAPPQGLDR